MNRYWTDELTEEEAAHVRGTTRNGTIEEFLRNCQAHQEMRTENPEGPEPCWTCKAIARKLREKGRI